MFHLLLSEVSVTSISQGRVYQLFIILLNIIIIPVSNQSYDPIPTNRVLLGSTGGHIIQVSVNLLRNDGPLPPAITGGARSAGGHVAQAGGQHSRGLLVSVHIEQAAVAHRRTENGKYGYTANPYDI